MKKQFKQVADFQIATDQPVNNTPTLLTPEYESLRFKLMREENEEYFSATEDKSLVEVLDACIDMAYVLAGTINSHGLADIFENAFDLVHANNMTKVVDGKVLRDENGKIVKPSGFVPVDLSKVLSPLYKPKKSENFYPIMSGDRFLCTKDYIMDDGDKAYTEGKEYISYYNNCITDDQLDAAHRMDTEGDEDDTINYFIKL